MFFFGERPDFPSKLVLSSSSTFWGQCFLLASSPGYTILGTVEESRHDPPLQAEEAPVAHSLGMPRWPTKGAIAHDAPGFPAELRRRDPLQPKRSPLFIILRRAHMQAETHGPLWTHSAPKTSSVGTTLCMQRKTPSWLVLPVTCPTARKRGGAAMILWSLQNGSVCTATASERRRHGPLQAEEAPCAHHQQGTSCEVTGCSPTIPACRKG